MQSADRKGKQPLAIVGLDVEHNTQSPSFAISAAIDSVVSRWSLQDDNLGTEEAIWRLPNSALTQQPGQAWSISIHPDPSTSIFATSGIGGQTRILSGAIQNFGEEKLSIPSKSQFATCVYSPNGKVLATATSDGNVYLYDSETGQMLTYWIGELEQFRYFLRMTALNSNAVYSALWQCTVSSLLARLVIGYYRRRRQADQRI